MTRQNRPLWHGAILLTGTIALVTTGLLTSGQTGVAGATTKSTTAIYAATFESNSRIYRINVSQHSVTFVGIASHEISDIAATGATLYGIDFGTFYRISTRSGLATEVGALGVVSDANALTSSPQGKLFGAGQSGDFFSLNPSNASVKVLGSYGHGLNSCGDLAFVGKILYATVSLHATTPPGCGESFLATVNPASGAAKLVGDTLFQNVWGLATIGGKLYGATSDGAFFQLNLKTGRATSVWKEALPIGGLTTLVSH